ncbi:type I glyceraldehyde-3-phosphate dehydrogenase [Marimonas sp. MJW-29]|uniref:Type I glyceraldehyde-3-phosphate dehydrogenase n=1 Tax=Sulfitobacter sediminis TaxID=3234186 RepID=A0ABV3RJM5_9RHOB
MAVKLGINGFGRIGRSILRALMERPPEGLEVVAINDPAPLETIAHLFEFDSIHGRYRHPVTTGPDWIDVGAGPIRVTSEPAPENLPWRDVDIALECTGQFRTTDQAARHLQDGASRVLLSSPARDDMKTVIYGMNHDSLAPGDRLVSNGSCTTNCLVPVAHVLDEAFGILRGHMTTVHCYTGNQYLHDRAHEDIYRARAGALSMVPTVSGSAGTLGRVLPHLAGKIASTAIRVPTPNVSCCDLVVETRKAATPSEITAAMQAAADGPLAGILSVERRKLVSVDYRQDVHSAIYAADQTEVQEGTLLRVLAWYDNEWAFSHRMLDVARVMGGLD